MKGYFQENRYFDNAMYVSLFGDVPDSVNIDRRSIIRNKNILDIEQGNSPFGGYGKKSNFVWDGSRPEARPFLVSEELYKFGIKKRKKNRR